MELMTKADIVTKGSLIDQAVVLNLSQTKGQVAMVLLLRADSLFYLSFSFQNTKCDVYNGMMRMYREGFEAEKLFHRKPCNNGFLEKKRGKKHEKRNFLPQWNLTLGLLEYANFPSISAFLKRYSFVLETGILMQGGQNQNESQPFHSLTTLIIPLFLLTYFVHCKYLFAHYE